MFAGSDSGGERAAAAYSLIETAKLNGLDPEDYLRQVLARIADHPVRQVDEFGALEHESPPWRRLCNLFPRVRRRPSLQALPSVEQPYMRFRFADVRLSYKHHNRAFQQDGGGAELLASPHVVHKRLNEVDQSSPNLGLDLAR